MDGIINYVAKKENTQKRHKQDRHTESKMNRLQSKRIESNRVGNCSNQPFAIIMKHYSVYSNFVNFVIVCVLTVALYSQMFSNVQMYSEQQKSSIITIAARVHIHTHKPQALPKWINNIKCFFSVNSHTHNDIYFLMDLPGLHGKWNFCCCFFFVWKAREEKVLMGICGNNFYIRTTTTSWDHYH